MSLMMKQSLLQKQSSLRETQSAQARQKGAWARMERHPLKCWKGHDEAEDWGPLSKLAHMVLAAPASSAPVERVFSEGALIASKRRQRMQHENVSLMLFLHNGWDKVREFRLSSAAGE